MTTHLKDIYGLSLIEENYLVRLLTMSCMQEQQNENKLIYLYKVKCGFCENSYSII